MSTVQIGDRSIGGTSPCYVIAEAGVNHNGDPDQAHSLIDTAHACGADAVKFQAFVPELVVAPATDAAPYQRERGAVSQLALLQELVLPEPAWAGLADHASGLGLHFLCTAFDEVSAELVVGLGVPALKVPSGEIDNIRFIRWLAALGKPLLISTGTADLAEVSAAVEVAAAAPGLALFHCVTAYPARLSSCNLRVIRTMSETFGVPVGWSDHTESSVSAVASITLGASLLEKHITLDRNLPGPDHAASADPGQFDVYVRAVRAAESALGDGIKRPAPEEEVMADHVRRSWHAARDLVVGERLNLTNVRLVRPAGGLRAPVDPDRYVVTRAIRAGAPVTEPDVREDSA